jgi:hypothetical protein
MACSLLAVGLSYDSLARVSNWQHRASDVTTDGSYGTMLYEREREKKRKRDKEMIKELTIHRRI